MKQDEDIKLESLVGKHILTGVDTGTIKVKNWGEMEDANFIRFVVDGVAYMAVEDPSDGYRSSMKSLMISDEKCTNIFPKHIVMGKMKSNSNWGENDILELYDINNGRLVLSVGTSNTDDYYPCFEAQFTPENLSINSRNEINK